MTRSLQQKEAWTVYKGEPVYWLAPEFWDPAKGLIRLVLPGENPAAIESSEAQKRAREFMILQGDPRYLSKADSARMRRKMIERLGTDTPWRGIPPQTAQHPAKVGPLPIGEVASLPF